MVNAHLDVLELELRKLDGVRAVGFSSQHDVLYIQLFIDAHISRESLPFEATRIAQRHSSSPVAVELVRWINTAPLLPTTPALAPQFSGMGDVTEEPQVTVDATPVNAFAGSISNQTADETQAAETEQVSDSLVEDEIAEEQTPDQEDAYDAIVASNTAEEVSYPDVFQEEINAAHEDEENEIDLSQEEITYGESDNGSAFDETVDRRNDDDIEDRIALITVTTSAKNDEIEVHLSLDELRTIGRAPTNRGLLGAIDATVAAIAELTGSNEFHAEWARSLEPGAEHASLVAVGLANAEGTDTRHGIAGGASPIEAAARATLNALNRLAAFSGSDA
jgi:hypothetical protein